MVNRNVIVGLLLLGACAQEDLGARAEPSGLDLNYFRCQVQPVLAARCSFMACHGNDDRPFRIFAEQRHRLGIEWIDYETPLTDEELESNFRLASGLVAPRNLLALKPLDTRAGGRFHRARDLYGSDDVFTSADDPGYRALLSFAKGVVDSPDCTPVEDAYHDQ